MKYEPQSLDATGGYNNTYNGFDASNEFTTSVIRTNNINAAREEFSKLGYKGEALEKVVEAYTKDLDRYTKGEDIKEIKSAKIKLK